jgi:hypothetical protein
MRWKQLFRAACLAAAITGGAFGLRSVAARDMDDFDVQIIPAENSSFWSTLFDTRISIQRPSFDFLSGGMPDRLIYHAGLDVTSWSVSAHGVVQWAANGFDKDGFIMRFFVSEGFERYTDGYRNFDTQITRGHILPGYLFHIGGLELQVLAGIDGEADLLFIDNAPKKWRSNIGVRGTVDAWWEPTRFVMLQSALSATTIDNGYNTRVAAGWRLYDWFWVGPEAALSNDFFSQQTRIGAHITGLRTGQFEWSAAAGHVHDNFQREGLYARFGLTIRPLRQPFFEN